MATFTVTTAQNIDALASKTGGDIYNINGGTLTIDQDSRFWLNNSNASATGATSMGNITISATLGGILDVDARFVRIIPYNTWSGNVPALGTTITQWSASWKLISVMSTLTSAPTAVGAAMPATGFIKIKAWNSVRYTAWALTGIGASATWLDTDGWIELAWDESSTCTVPRLWTARFRGAWYSFWTTNGVANQQFQVPTQGLAALYIPGIFVQKSAASPTNNYTGGYAKIKVESAWNQSLWSWEIVPIRLSLNTTNFVEFLITNNTVYARKTVAWTNTNITTIAFNSTTMKFFRIRESSWTTYWDYSQDWSSWTNLTSQANPIAVTSLYYGMIAGTWNAEVSTTSATLTNVELATSAGIVVSDTFWSGQLDIEKWNAWGSNWYQSWGYYQFNTTLAAAYSGLDNAQGFEFYPNAASQTSVATDIRAKVCWISSAGLIRIWHNGTANAGYLPPSWLKVAIPNIFLQNCTATTRNANALPNATLATRYDFTTTGGGVIEMDKVSASWYLSFAQAFSVTLTNLQSNEQISVSEIASFMNWTKIWVWQSAAQSQFALVMSLCFAWGTFTDCHWSRATLAASGNYTTSLTDITWFNFVNEMNTALTVKGNATSWNTLATRAVNCKWTNVKLTNWRMVFVTCTNIEVNQWSYADVITGTTATTAAQNSYVFEISSNTNGFTQVWWDFFGLTNVQPYLWILSIAAAWCSNIKMRSIWTRASPLSLWSTNNSAYLYVLATWAAASNIKIQRCYVTNTRTGLYTGDNSSTGITHEKVFGDYADAPVSPMLNFLAKGVWCTHALTAQTATYGTHFVDMFTSTTAGRIAILMNETTSLTSSQVTLSGGANFTSAGWLYMPTIGMQAIFEMPYFALGHTSFQNLAAVMAGWTIGNYTLEYQIDKNNGSGYNGTWKTLSWANLSGETGIDASKWVKLKFRITTSTTNITAITSLYVLTNSSTTAQDYEYPLDVVNVNLTGLKSGSEVRAYNTISGENNLEIGWIESSWTSFSFTSENGTINIMINHLNYLPADIWWLVVWSSDITIPISQFVDRQYLNP